jgi:hypothetical protein
VEIFFKHKGDVQVQIITDILNLKLEALTVVLLQTSVFSDVTLCHWTCSF